MQKILPATLLLTAISASTFALTQPPNVIFILADDLGYSDIEPYGQKIIRTPNLSKMAENGMQFMQFYCGTSVSAPSRASLLTGLHTGHTHVRGNKEYLPEGQEPLGNFLTLGNLFRQAGYATGIYGKWGLGFPGSDSEPTKKGFDQFFGYNCQRQSHSYFPEWLWKNNEKKLLTGKEYSPDLIHREALTFIRSNAHQPFFAFLSYTLPHAGLEQPDDSILRLYSGKFAETPFKGYGDYAPANEPLAQYAGMVTRLDAYVGEIRKELERLGIAENTLLIFTSDNGPHTEGGNNPDFFNNSRTLRGLKRSLYEGGIRIPAIMEWKGTIQPGTKSELPAAFWDFIPTFAQLTGQSATWKQKTDGISILPVLMGKANRQKRSYFYWEFHEEGGRQAVRQGDWKLIKQMIKSGNPTFELYNLKNDPFEKRDLSAENPARVRKLKKRMEKAHTPSEMFNFGIIK